MIAYAVSQVEVINEKLQPKMKNSVVFPLLQETGNYIIKLDTAGLHQEVTKHLDKAVEATKQTVQEISEEEIKKER